MIIDYCLGSLLVIGTIVMAAWGVWSIIFMVKMAIKELRE